MEQKHQALLAQLRTFSRVAVAFSGGVDSTYLAFAAKQALGQNAVAITADTAFLPREEIAQCHALAKQLGIAHTVLDLDIFRAPQVIQNPKDRCYHCKKIIMQAILDAAQGAAVLDGSNADDDKDYRPGKLALEQLHIHSPLKDVGMSKADIRALSASFDLPTHDKPAYACLASRIPCDTAITRDALRMVEQAEALLHKLGFTQIRVRHHGAIARIEAGDVAQFVRTAKFADINGALQQIGFDYVTLDLQGYTMSGLRAK